MPVTIQLPALSPGMTEGKLVRWLRKEGEPVRRGEVIAEIETDKSVLDLEAIEDGRIGKLLVPDGTEGIAVGTPLALLAVATGASADDATGAPTAQRIAASPLARRLAAESGMDLRQVSGSGPGGRIVKADIERSTDLRAVLPAPAPNTNARRIIARRLSEAAATIPHYYLTIDCPVDALLALRAQLNAETPEAGRVSINDFIIRACALALKKVPQVNASWHEEAIRANREIDIAIAVDAPDGLITPIVRNADAKGVRVIASEMRELTRRARAHKLRPDEFQGGGFTISNLGMHGVRQFTSIINPPHAAALAVGAAEPRAIVRDGGLCVATVMTCTMSCDHRVLDGATGAAFLGCFRELVAEPLQLT